MPSASQCLHMFHLDSSNLYRSLGVQLQMIILNGRSQRIEEQLSDQETCLSTGPDLSDDLRHNLGNIFSFSIPDFHSGECKISAN